MAVKGVFASDQNIQASRKGDFAAGLLQVVPTGSARLLSLSAGMEEKDAIDTITTWFEENHLSGRNTITNNAGTGTTMVFSDATQVEVGQVYMAEASGEYVFIDAITGSSATVTRGFGDTSPGALDGSVTPVPLQLITQATEEASARPVAIANIGFPRFNYIQTLRHAWDVSGVAQAVEYHTGPVVAKNKRDAALFHAEAIERAIIWGKKAIGTLNSRVFRTMDGIRYQLSSNIASQASDTDWDDLDTFLQAIFEKNIKGKPNERIVFCGNTVVRVLNKIARLDGITNLVPGETSFGLKVTKWETPFGDISLMTHPLMNESPLWTKDMLVIHPGAVRMRWLRRTFEDSYDRDGTRAGVDADFGVMTSDCCIEYMAEATGGYYSGIDTAAATA